jgi:uncharacterized protein YndB with AHSA1/START domain
MTDNQAGDAVVIERTFDDPIETIWQMWTDPAHVQAWYGPDGASVPEITLDVRVGGQRRVCMEVPSPNGLMRMWFTGQYLEVNEPHRLVFTEAITPPEAAQATPDGVAPPGHAVTTITVELEAIGSRTQMVMTHAGIPADSPGATGWKMAFDKMATRAAHQHT